MSAQEEKTKINLLPRKGFEATTKGRVLLWILSSFRVIVIVTELLVMVAFLSRFWLDARNTDLNEEIDQKRSVLAASLDFERDFKDAQKRIQIFSELTENENLLPEGVETITAYLPPDVVISSINFSANQARIEGFSPNERSIQQLMVNLENSAPFEETTIVKIESARDNEALLVFEVNATTTGGSQ